MIVNYLENHEKILNLDFLLLYKIPKLNVTISIYIKLLCQCIVYIYNR